MNMKHLKLFEELVDHYYMINNYYDFYGKIIFVTDLVEWSPDEYQVTYTNNLGEISSFITPMKEIEDDLINTTQSFTIEDKKDVIKTPKRVPVDKYNLVYYKNRNSKYGQPIDKNLDSHVANYLMRQYKAGIVDKRFQIGIIKKELVK